MKIADFDYDLPDALIAQQPLADRSASRMLVVKRNSGEILDDTFSSIYRYLRAGDTLVLNNTKVFPARLIGRSNTGAKIELFLVKEIETGTWQVLARPAKRLPAGKKIRFNDELEAEVLEKLPGGGLVVSFTTSGDLSALIDKVGKTPLPPYIKRGTDKIDEDRERYQTVFAKNRGAIAAPTAGLHFSPEMLEEVRDARVTLCEITLHVGYGTFEPVRVQDVSEHRVLAEQYEIGEEAAETLNQARKDGKRIIAVGTTTTRTLESALTKRDRFVAEKANAELTIVPGYKFRVIDALITNFHLPKSSLLVLVSTFAGHDLIMKAYQHAVDSSYRFYSYGDCMFIS